MFEVLEKATGKSVTVYGVNNRQFLIENGDGEFEYRDMNRYNPVRVAIPAAIPNVRTVSGYPCTASVVNKINCELSRLLDDMASGVVPVERGFSIATRLKDGTHIDLVVTEVDDKMIRLETRDYLPFYTSAQELSTFLDMVYSLLPDPLKSRIAEVERQHRNGKGEIYAEKVKLFVPAVSEMFPSDKYENRFENKGTEVGDKDLYEQMEWYKDVHNRVRGCECDGGDGKSHWYWTSSPLGDDFFYRCYSDGDVDYCEADATYGRAPFGCIILKKRGDK